MTSVARENLREFLSSGSSKMGSVFLLLLIIVSIGVVLAYPLDFGVRLWSNPSVWADNPKAAPPAWINFLSPAKKVESLVLESYRPVQETTEPDRILRRYTFSIDFPYESPPTFLSFTLKGVTYQGSSPIIKIGVTRPDEKNIQIYQMIVPGPRPQESAPYQRFHETPLRVQLSGDSVVADSVVDFLSREYSIPMSTSELLIKGPEKVVFGVPVDKSIEQIETLRGRYVIDITAVLSDQGDRIESVRFVVGGAVFGSMGTDSLGRDIAVGLLFGFPVALFIGLVTSTLTTAIGSVTGVVSGYVGGRVDHMIQRVSDVLNNVPLLPLLIFLSFITGQKLWIVILILILFGWPGLTILVRSMVLQIKSNQFVEAAVSLGASRWRVMLRHVFPQTAPFVIGQLIFFTPSAILAEAALSFLGLGDPSIPTWGQILEHGFRNGGVYVGYWWWILPPGLLVVLTAMTFVFLALGMEPMINPRLRRIK